MLIRQKLLIITIIFSQISFGQEGKVFYPFGHSEFITCLSFSPDGSLLASSSGDEGCVLIWDIKTGREIAALPGSADHIVFSPDGKFMAYGGDLATLQLWDLMNLKSIKLKDMRGNIGSIAFSPDSRYLAYSADFVGQVYMDRIQMRDISTGEVVSSFTDKIKSSNSMAFSPTDSILAVSAVLSESDIIELWNPYSGKLIKTLKERGDQLMFSNDGNYLFARGGRDGLYIIAVPKDSLIHFEPSIGYAAGFSKSGEVAAYSVGNKIGTIFNLAEKKKIRTLNIGSIWKTAYDPCNNVYGAIIDRGKITIIEAENSRRLKILGDVYGKINRPIDIYFNSVDPGLTIQIEDSSYRIWSSHTNQIQKSFNLFHKSKSGDNELSPGQRKYLKEDEEYEGEKGYTPIDYYCSSPDKKYLAVTRGYMTDIIDCDSNQYLQYYQLPPSGLKYLFSGDSRKFILKIENRIIINDIRSGKELGSLVLLDDTDWVFITPEGLYEGTPKGIKFPQWLDKCEPVLLENSNKCRYVPGLLKQILNLDSQNRVHPSVRNWKENVIIGKSRNLIIRIDMTENGLRYVSWSKGHNVSERPDLILINGVEKTDSVKRCRTWIFENEGWTYNIDDIEKSDSLGKCDLFLKLLYNGTENKIIKLDKIK
jgi:WD40 repeat protein